MECTDTCPYIEDGDFICTATNDNDVVIVGRAPMECVCPNKRRQSIRIGRIINSHQSTKR